MAADVRFLAEPSTFGETDFAGPPHFHGRDRLIVEAVGDHRALVPALEELLGPELATFFGFDAVLACDGVDV